MSKSCLSQQPLVLLRHSKLENMPLTGPTTLAPRNPLGEKLQKEYLKTAELVKRPPWHLNSAADYLTTWVENNVAGAQQEAPPFSLEKLSLSGGLSVLTECEHFQEFAPNPPKVIVAEPGPPALPAPIAKGPAAKPKAKAAGKAKAKCKAKVKAKAKAKANLKRPAARVETSYNLYTWYLLFGSL